MRSLTIFALLAIVLVGCSKQTQQAPRPERTEAENKAMLRDVTLSRYRQMTERYRDEANGNWNTEAGRKFVLAVGEGLAKGLTKAELNLTRPEEQMIDRLRAPQSRARKGHYEDLGVSGFNFANVNIGTMQGLELGLFFLHALDDTFWIINFEAERTPLDERNIYFARLKTARPCGPWLPEFQTPPAYCIAEELIIPWPDAKTRLRRALVNSEYTSLLTKVEPWLLLHVH